MQHISFPNSAAPLGSSAYYVIRFSPEKIRNNLAALFSWKQELIDLYAISDPGVARMKLQWWQEQLFKPTESPSEHALARTLSGFVVQDESLANAVKTMIGETDRHLHRQTYEDFEDLWLGCKNIGGSFAALINHAVFAQDQNTDQLVGAYCTATEWLQLMGQHIRLNIRLIPQSILNETGIRFEELLYENNRDQTRHVLKLFYQQLENQTTYPAARRSPSPLYKYYRLRKKLMNLLVSEDFDVIDQKISLTPIRKLWLAL